LFFISPPLFLSVVTARIQANILGKSPIAVRLEQHRDRKGQAANMGLGIKLPTIYNVQLVAIIATLGGML
jgi:hypothetical protein